MRYSLPYPLAVERKMSARDPVTPISGNSESYSTSAVYQSRYDTVDTENRCQRLDVKRETRSVTPERREMQECLQRSLHQRWEGMLQVRQRLEEKHAYLCHLDEEEARLLSELDYYQKEVEDIIEEMQTLRREQADASLLRDETKQRITDVQEQRKRIHALTA